ncbi:hypothetical protein FXV83_09595 [Bradyrhizobium hipponense]|uniref:Uncharacterized protein n=1 Tax=Bradyrhizobium hipponense TaxID=2605638 RepID=A0A5S4YSA7_9BRAD|nr:hypothetical protein [Bradyrhizobium hipponense]TYO66812.1 hypothetical protein FXV83_09595 [Bradyrhizobium hipponense]
MKRIIIALALLASTAIAQAGSNECGVVVKVGQEWTTVTGDIGDYAPDGCRFRTASKLGRRILAVCPNGADCDIYVRLGSRGKTITAIDSVSRAVP